MHYGRIDATGDDEFVSKSVRLLAAHIKTFLAEFGQCSLALSGGSTPKPIYAKLALTEGIDWSSVIILLVDDRYIAPDHADSNQKMLRETLLSGLVMPEENIIFPNTTLPLAECIVDYDRRVRKITSKEPIDIATFGMGDDGHTASLFPPLTAEAFDAKRAVIHTTTDQFAVHDRISLTLPTLQAVKVPIFFLKGEVKKKVWKEMAEAKGYDPRRWPALGVLKEGRGAVVFG